MQIALGAAAALVIIGVAVVLQPLVSRDAPVSSVTPVTEVAVVPDPVPEIAQPQPDVVIEIAPMPTPEPAPVAAPVIDLVRIEPDGSGIIAGQAQPGVAVAVLLGAQILVEAVADTSGRFVAFVALPASDQPRVLSLVADPAGAATPSEATVIIAPTVIPSPEIVAAVISEPPLPAESVSSPENPVAETTPVTAPDSDMLVSVPEVSLPAAAPQPETTPVIIVEAATLDVIAETVIVPAAPPGPGISVPEATDETTALANPTPTPTVLPEQPPAISDSVTALQTPVPDAPAVAPVLLADASGVRILQPALAPGATPEVLATVALDAIAYDAAGEVQLSGRATGGGVVRVYVDNRVVVEVPVDASGQWTSGLPDVPTGVYTMRVDQIDAAGQVVSRIETPFLREERATVAQVMEDQTAAADFAVAVKTVQPGATLWAIARERYGDGVLYVQVFEANRDRIRNPDLIYPGQVFVLPEIVTE